MLNYTPLRLFLRLSLVALAGSGSAFGESGAVAPRALSTAWLPHGRKQVLSLPPGAETALTSQQTIPEQTGGDSMLPRIPFRSTRSSFLANWQPIPGAISYRVDVSTDRNFQQCVSGYEKLATGNVTSRIICRLQPGTRYYYRVQAYDSSGPISMSAVMAATTAAESGLVIEPTFDSSITTNPNAAAIESTITNAIALYQSLFGDPITVQIRFRYATSGPDGQPLPDGVIGESFYVVYDLPWSTYVSSMRGDAKTANDLSANADLPAVPLTTYLVPSSGSGRAVGLDTPPAMFADGTVGAGGPYDGIVTLNSSASLQFIRPVNSTHYDARAAVEHEMDEVLGLGSYLGGSPESTDFRPQDLFSWSAQGIRSHAAVGLRYFSIDDGITNIVNFSQVSGADYGDWESDPCPQTHPYVQNAAGCTGQASDISATSPEGTNLDVIGYDLTDQILAPPDVLGNISTRAFVGVNDQVLIGGFIISGTESKRVVLRAIGPSLPLSGTLADPLLELHDSTGAIIGSNDNWRSSQAPEIIDLGLSPSNDAESALVSTLDPGAYTVIVRGADGGTGIGLVEAYEIDSPADAKLANISTRALVKTGDDVLIGGFIILGQNGINTLVRAIGPSLPVSGPLADPSLELYNSDGDIINSNDDWRTDQEGEIIATGNAPANDAESAIVATLSPGAYTAIVRGKNNATGLALVEVYNLDN